MNDNRPLSLRDTDALLAEINRLRARVAELETLVGELDELAYIDPLVRLPNRRSFLRSLERLIARAQRYDEPAAMVFVDLDGLKRINDTFGHEAGDAALVQVAEILSATVRQSDSAARLSGDEFAILLERADELSAWHMALRVVEAVMGAQFLVNGRCLKLSVAVGVGVVQASDTVQTVMQRADKSMYRLKAIGRDGLGKSHSLTAVTGRHEGLKP